MRLRGPERIILERDASAPVVLEGKSEKHLRWYTNVGEITQPKEEPPGRFVATYTPRPGVKYPHIAIVAAVSDDNRVFAWTAIPLVGSASVKIETKPEATVKLRVGTADYGPVKTDTRGIVRITVQVQPGVTQATVFATDTLGNASASSMALGVPATSRILAVCPKKGDQFLLFAVDEKASPLRKAEIAIQSFPLTTGSVERLSDGVFTSSIQVPNGINAGNDARLTAHLADDPALTSSCTTRFPLKPSVVSKDFVPGRDQDKTDQAAADRAGSSPYSKPWLISLRLGYLTNFGRISAPLGAAVFGLRLPFAERHVVVGAEVGYYASSTEDAGDNGNDKVTTSVTSFPLLARVMYQFPLGPVLIYPGLGAGVLFADTKVTSKNTGTAEVDEPYFLLAGFLGASIKAGPGRALVEVGYWHSRIHERSVKGSLAGLHITAGYEVGF